MRSQKVKFVVAFAVVAGGVVFLMAGKLRGAFRYSESLAAITSAGDALQGRSLRVQAKYVDGSLVKAREGGKVYFEFQVEDGPAKLTIRYDDAPPDTLVNGAQVTVEGQVVRAGYFHATKVFAKCPSKYDSREAPAGYQPPDPYSAAGRGHVREHPRVIPMQNGPVAAPANPAPAGTPAAQVAPGAADAPKGR